MQNQSSAPPSLHAFPSPLSALLQSPPTRFRRRDLHLLFCCCSRHGFPDGEASGSQRLRLTCFCTLNCSRVHAYRRLLYVCVHVFMPVYMCVFIHECVHTCMNMFMYVCKHMSLYLHAHNFIVSTHMCIHELDICVHVYAFVCMYSICIYVFFCS